MTSITNHFHTMRKITKILRKSLLPILGVFLLSLSLGADGCEHIEDEESRYVREMVAESGVNSVPRPQP